MKSRSRNKVRGRRATSRRCSPSRGKSLRPFVSATFAMTVDGKITTRAFGPVDFTSREDKLHLFQQRALADAVAIGHSTLKRDNVRLGISEDLRAIRIKRGQTPAPLRVIVSPDGTIVTQVEICPPDSSMILLFSFARTPNHVRGPLRLQCVTVHKHEP